MFEFLFKYPASAFAKGDVVFLGRWPVWGLFLALVLVAALLAIPFWRKRMTMTMLRSSGLWILQTGLVALLLLVLWQPALSISTLRPQQNVVAVVVDDSKSMQLQDEGVSRLERAKTLLDSGVLADLQKRFQVRLYRAGTSVDRIEDTKAVDGSQGATRIGDAVRQVVAESSSLPIGAVVVLSDGADNAGGIDYSTMSEIRRYRVPVHTVGFGKENLDRDVEVTDVSLPARVLADSRVSADVTLRQSGFASRKGRIQVRSGDKVLGSREVTFKADGTSQTESVAFSAGTVGARGLQILVDVDGEANKANNSVSRLLAVEDTKPRILYIEGEPKWEFKFLRRAIGEDSGLRLASMLRTTQNKLYRQGIDAPNELLEGFPATVDELFGYHGIIIGGVEANYFTTTQQELIRQFVDRRGGGILFLGGRGAFSYGGWQKSSLADLLPVVLPERKETFRRDYANAELTPAGRDSLLCRIDDNPERNVERWRKLPQLQNFQDTGTAKPGAAVLAEMTAGRSRMPLLVTQNYGRGRVAVFATSGSWRWQMVQPLDDKSHEMFWQQMVRWIASGTRGQVISSTPKSVFSDEVAVPLRVEVRDKNYLPVADAAVKARVLTPGGSPEEVELRPDPVTAGVYTATWGAERSGEYVAEVIAGRGDQELGRDVITFRREDGVAENFRTAQNRELLEKLSSQTGGRYYKPAELSKLNSEIAYSEAGISTKEMRDLWDMPALFLIAIVLRSAEWLLRRKWGIV